MTDTNPAIASKFIQLIMAKSPAERLAMGCSMFDAAKEIIKNSIRENIPKSACRNLKKEIFLRFYGTDFDEATKKKMLQRFVTENG